MNEDNYRTYYDISRDQLRAAKLLLHSYPNDDGMINIAAYNLQQSIDMPDIKEFMKNQSENENSIKSR